MESRGLLVNRGLWLLSLASMLVTLYLIFMWVPTDAVLGIVQRVFYFHVGMAWVGFLAFGVVFVGSVAYLWKGSSKWDTLAHSSAEIGVLFTTLMIVSGILWAKPVWGVWWTWDARLTTSLILWFIYVAYLMLRAYVPSGRRAARYAAVFGIVGFVDVPVVYFAATIWRTLHPQQVLGPLAGERAGLDPSMLLTLLVSVATFTLLYALLLSQRYSLRQEEGMVDEIVRTQEALI